MRSILFRPMALLGAAALLGVTAGCQRQTQTETTSERSQENVERTYRIVKPERKTVRRRIEQPGFNIEAFQQTAVFARISGYVQEWKVDIGDSVKKGDLLAELYVPEMEVAVKQKEAAVLQAQAQVKQAQAAQLTARAQQARAKRQYERLSRVGQGGMLDRDSVDETRLGYEAAQASLEKAKADVTASAANVEVAKAERDYAQTMLQYRRLLAPFDGVVTQRNINDQDLVQPAGVGGKAQPLYVVQQIDPVRVFVNVPGTDAMWLKDGDPVSFRLQGAGGELFTGKVTRNARSLDPQARTLRTEIDVRNPKGALLPGMYVQAVITVQHKNVWSLPASAVVTEGDQTFCYRVEGGKAVRTLLQIGLSGGHLIEVMRKQVKSSSSDEEEWEDFTGQEEIVADPAGLSDGQPVHRKSAK